MSKRSARREQRQREQEKQREQARVSALSPLEQALEAKARTERYLAGRRAARQAYVDARAAKIARDEIGHCFNCGDEVPAARYSDTQMIILPHGGCQGVGQVSERLNPLYPPPDFYGQD